MDNTRYIFAGAALGACAGALAGWAYHRRAMKGNDAAEAVKEVDKARALRVLWAVVGVIRLVFEMDQTGA